MTTQQATTEQTESATARRVFDFLAASPLQCMTIADLATACGQRADDIDQAVDEMADDGTVALEGALVVLL